MSGETNQISSAPDDMKRIEEITRVVLQVLASERQSVGNANRGVARVLENLKAYWPLVVGAVSVVLAVAVWLIVGVSPLESAREIKDKKQQRMYRQQLAQQHIQLGNDFLNVGQIPAAKAEFTRARDLDAYNIAADFGLLKVSVFESIPNLDYDPEVADRRLHAILKQKEKDTHALTFLGDVYSGITPDQALRYYDEALKSDSNNTYAYFRKGILFDQQRRTADALGMYEKARSLSGWNQALLNNLAYQYYLGRDYLKAQALYILLLSLDGRFLLSYCMLANSQLMLGEPWSSVRQVPSPNL